MTISHSKISVAAARSSRKLFRVTRQTAGAGIAALTAIALTGCGDSTPPPKPTPTTGAAVRGTPINAPAPSGASANAVNGKNGGGIGGPPSGPMDALIAGALPAGLAGPPAPVGADPAGVSGAGGAASGQKGRFDPNAALGKPDDKKPEYMRVIFDELASFDYDPFEAGAPSLGSTDAPPAESEPNKQVIPANVLALNKKKISLQGFMVPIEFNRQSVRSFLLVRNQMACCFGVMIGMNEWILVQMDGEKKTPFVQDVPTLVYGEMEVGEDIQNGMVMSIFRMKGHDVIFLGGR